MDIFLLKQFLKNLVLPPTGALLVAIVGWVWAAFARRRAVPYALCAAGLGLLWVLSTPIVADGLMRSAELYPPLDLGKPVAAQAIVILAGGVRVHAPEYAGQPAPNSPTLQRLVYGALVARTTGLPVLVSGYRAEARAMRTFLERDLAVTPRWIENDSRDTEQNAERSAAILVPAGVRRILLVTSSEHMARALVEFRVAGLDPIPAPAEMWTRRDQGPLVWVPNAGALMRSHRALYEFLGRLVQWVRLERPGHRPRPA